MPIALPPRGEAIRQPDSTLLPLGQTLVLRAAELRQLERRLVLGRGSAAGGETLVVVALPIHLVWLAARFSLPGSGASRTKVRRLAYSAVEAAEALGVSRDYSRENRLAKPKRARLETVSGLWVRRGFKSLPLR